MQNKPGITFSAYTYGQLGAEAFTLELGKARPFGENQEVNLERLEAMLEAADQRPARNSRTVRSSTASSCSACRAR